jgi:hypothetical protein
MCSDSSKLLNKFNDECKKIHNALEANMSNQLIYHYTSFSGLKSILKMRKLRYTDYRYFNDPTELKFGEKQIRESILNSDIPHKGLLGDHIGKFFDQFDQDNSFYISCFSSSKDKLSLWRYYANNGTGFAIGFNGFQKTLSEGTIRDSSLISKVIYGEEKAQDILNKFILKYLEIIKEAASSVVNDKDSFVRNMDIYLFSHLLSFLPSFKDKSFSDEDEIRLIRMEGESLIIPKTGKPFYIDDSFREFIPFTTPDDIPFVPSVKGSKPVIYPEEFKHTDISKILVGSCCDFSEARMAIRRLLLDYGYNEEKIIIERALLPFRVI